MKITKEVSEIISKLDSVNWNFPGTSTLQNTVHSLHRFPGNYIPQVPSYLIQILSQHGDLVLDPFCGSGTTGIEALILGRRTHQSDVNLASIQVARGKIAMLMSQNIKQELRKVLDALASYPLTHFIALSDTKIDPELKSWFHNDTLTQLETIWAIISRTEDTQIRDVLIILFTDTLFACASTGGALTSGGKARRHHWGWIADNVKPKPPQWHNAIKVFRDRLIHAYDVASTLETTTTTRLSYLDSNLPQVRRQDIRQLDLPDSSVDLIVTSPPYLGMIDYTLANRLTYLWFGWSLSEDKQLEIGARHRRAQKNVVKEYLESIEISCKHIARVLRDGAYCAIVIGSSRKFPEVTNQALQIFGHYLESVWGPTQRNPSRRRVAERRGTEFYEYVCVFRK